MSRPASPRVEPVRCIVASLLVFAAVVAVVVTGVIHPFDFGVLDWLREPGRPPENLLGPIWLYGAAVAVTALGSTTVLCAAGVVLAIAALVMKRRREAALIAVAILGGSLLNRGLKEIFVRERPDEIFRAVEAHNASFPSGHAMLSAAAFLTLAILVTRLTGDRRLHRSAFAAAGVFAVLIGLTRIYLGVHWTSDVVAGWSAGVAWAALSALLTRPPAAAPVRA